jgi:hypothetical protein
VCVPCSLVRERERERVRERVREIEFHACASEVRACFNGERNI